MEIIKPGNYPEKNIIKCKECNCEFRYYNSEVIVEMSTPEEVDMFDGFGVYKYVNCPQCHTNCTISCDFTEKIGFFKRIFCKNIKKKNSYKRSDKKR